MIRINGLIEYWPTLDASQKREIVLTLGYSIIEKYNAKRGITNVDFAECDEYNEKLLASFSHKRKKMLIYEKPTNHERIWNNPLIVIHNIPHEIGHVYQRRIVTGQNRYGDAVLSVASGGYTYMEIFCEIIAISIMNEYFKLYQIEDQQIYDYLHNCLVEMIRNVKEEYNESLSLLVDSEIDTKFGGIISKCKRLLIDPYFNRLKE